MNEDRATTVHVYQEWADYASCSCGWEGQVTYDPRKSWTGHLRRVGAKLAHKGANYGTG